MPNNLRLAIWYLTVTPVLDFILLNKNAKKQNMIWTYFWYNYAYLMQKLDMLHSKISKHTVITLWLNNPVALFKWIKHLFFKENIFDSCWKTKQHLSSARMSQRRRTLVLKKKRERLKGEIFSLFFLNYSMRNWQNLTGRRRIWQPATNKWWAAILAVLQLNPRNPCLPEFWLNPSGASDSGQNSKYLPLFTK